VWRVVVFPLLAASCLPAASSPPKPPDSYAVTQIAIGNVDNGHSLNSAGQVAGTSNGWAFLWTPVTPNGPVGNLVDTGGVPVQTYTAVAINDRGQVVGTTAVPAHAFLWSPETPNGTSGAVTAFLGSTAPDASYAVAINSFGQIAGGQGGAGFFWTPSTPNGATGTINPDSRLGGPHGINAINDFGQATLNYPATLFTPSVANGATGSFTPLSGLPGDRDAYLIAINRGGTILGVGCTNAGCDHGFLWTPTNANGTTGTAVEIPLPPGYIAMYPTALNAAGQVVGTIRTAESGSVPVLYSGGTVYDLSGLGGAPATINDRGQILLHNGDQVFLATPGIASPAPSPGTIAITIAVAFNPPAGLINPQLSQLAYPPPFTVSGTGCSAGGYNTPQTLYWAPGSTCTVTFLSPQSMRIGTRSLFQSWQDGAATSTRIIVAPASATTYTAVFAPQYLVTAVANPPGGGTLSGGGWYTGRSTATLVATPSSGYRISDWSPPLVAAGSTSASVTVFAAQTIEVNFGPLTSVAPNYLVTQIASNATSRGINDFGQVVGYSSGLPNGAFLWTPVAANSPAGSMTNLGALPVGNSGATDINERGQVIGVTTQTNWFGDVFSSRPFLWSPDSANGTSGTFVPFLGDPAFSFTSLVGINHYGQIAGNQKNGLGFLWTPSSPNGAIGTLQLDSHLTGVAGINDFGQAIVNAQPPALFTPSTPNSSTGSFVAIAGLPGNNPQFTAIDNHGTILGVSGGHIFVWTPTTPNGTSGTAAEILPLPGYVSMTPTAMNDAGQFVGTMPRADGVRFPFLYSGGTIYDLSTLGAQLKEMTPTGINDRGQIVGTNLGMAYLLTPGAAPPPPASGSVAVTITANVPLQTFTVGGSGCVSGGYVTPQTLYWTPGSSCTVTFVSPHSNSTGTRYVFAGWQGGVNANPRVFVAPAQAASYAATFSQQNLLVVKANPPEGGTVSGGGTQPAARRRLSRRRPPDTDSWSGSRRCLPWRGPRQRR
jgi:probable HAF family extracellular repeat protein